MLVLTLPILHAGMLRKREAASLTQGGPASTSGCRDSKLGRDILERDLSAASPCQWLVPSHTCLPGWRCTEKEQRNQEIYKNNSFLPTPAPSPERG